MKPLQKIRAHEAAVRRLSAQYSRLSGADREDLAQDGFVALLEMGLADDAPELMRHGYVEQRMRGAMLDALRSMDRCPRHQRKILRTIAIAEARLSAQLDRRPTDAELAGEAGLSLKEYFAARAAAHRSAQIPEPDETGEDRKPVDEVFLVQQGAESRDPADAATSAELRKQLAAAIDALPVRHRHVLVARVLCDRQLEEIGADLGVSGSRVCQMQKEALQMLRRALSDSQRV